MSMIGISSHSGSSQSPYATAVLANSPLAYYALAESSGTVLTDSSGNARNGTYSGSPTLGAAGTITGNTAVSFDGTDDYGIISYGSWMNSSSAFTIEAWIRPSSVTGIGNFLDRDVLAGRVFQWRRNGTSLEIIYWIAGGGGPTSIACGTVAINTWYHCAVTWDGTNARSYLNKALITTSVGNGTIFVPTLGSMVIGGSQGGNNIGVYTQFFAGRIDEVAIYGSALSLAQISAHYDAAA